MGRPKKDPSLKKNKNYFDEQEEHYVALYNSTTDSDEKNIIFTKYIYKPLKKMVHENCKKYNTGTDRFGLSDLESRAFSHVFDQIPKYVSGRIGKNGEPAKAYSYLNTVCKHFVRNEGKTVDKFKKAVSNIDEYRLDFEEVDKGKKDRYIVYMEEDKSFIGEPKDVDETVVSVFTENLKNFIENHEKLSKDELQVGNSLVLIMENIHSLTEDMSDVKVTPFFSKKKIISYIKNITNMKSKDITTNMSIFMPIYKKSLYDFHLMKEK
jgi:hypothetical protein